MTMAKGKTVLTGEDSGSHRGDDGSQIYASTPASRRRGKSKTTQQMLAESETWGAPY